MTAEVFQQCTSPVGAWSSYRHSVEGDALVQNILQKSHSREECGPMGICLSVTLSALAGAWTPAQLLLVVQAGGGLHCELLDQAALHYTLICRVCLLHASLRLRSSPPRASVAVDATQVQARLRHEECMCT